MEIHGKHWPGKCFPLFFMEIHGKHWPGQCFPLFFHGNYGWKTLAWPNVPAEIGMGDLGRSLQSHHGPVPFLKISFHETWTQAGCSCTVDTWWWCKCFTASIFSCSVPDQWHVMQSSSQCSSFDNMRGGINMLYGTCLDMLCGTCSAVHAPLSF